MKRFNTLLCILALCFLGFYGVGYAQDDGAKLIVGYTPTDAVKVNADFNVFNKFIVDEDTGIGLLDSTSKEVISESGTLITTRSISNGEINCHDCHKTINQDYVKYKVLKVPWRRTNRV